MISIKTIRENVEIVHQAALKRKTVVDFDQILKLDMEKRRLQSKTDELKQERNRISKEIGLLKKKNESDENLMSQMQHIASEIKTYDQRLSLTESNLHKMMMMVPNIPNDSVPVGDNESDNKVVRLVGKKPSFPFKPKPHWEIGEDLGILDFKRGAKITGSRFTLYKGTAARLERALINFMLDIHTNQHGYNEVLPPFIVNRQSLTGTGQLPKFEDDLFKLADEDYFLIPTAEVPVTNIHADEIIDKEALPIYYTAYTPCFRREAGSYGKDVRGLIRQHQFNKVELVKFVLPEQSYDELEALLLDAEEILKQLDIHYRVVCLCSGDLGFSAAKTYDIEVWLPGQDCYKEISSCSNFEAFQARRSNIRYKSPGKKSKFVHTINGSALAVGRTLVAILENYQQEDGTVTIPEKLKNHMGNIGKIEKLNW